MKYYHATNKEGIFKIVNDGIIKHSFGGVVFFCTDPIDACKFLLIRGEKEAYTIEVDLPEDYIKESNDHSEAFFQCKAYTYFGDVKLTGKEKVQKYEFDL